MSDQHPIELGWREWLALPELGIPAVKAKIDTGARTSALHAFNLQTYEENGQTCVRFGIHPLQKRTDIEVYCVAAVKDERVVTDSGGHREERYVIETPIKIADQEWLIEVTLTSRDDMLFRMLLGRTAMHKRAVVNPGASFLTGKRLAKKYR